MMLLLSDTPLSLSLIGSGVATLVSGTYLGLSLMGQPLKAIISHSDKFTTGKKAVYFAGALSRKLFMSLDSEK